MSYLGKVVNAYKKKRVTMVLVSLAMLSSLLALSAIQMAFVSSSTTTHASYSDAHIETARSVQNGLLVTEEEDQLISEGMPVELSYLPSLVSGRYSFRG